MYNQTLCIPRFCTSIIAQGKDGNVYHGRNLDYPHPVLRNLTINIIFLKNGEVQYIKQNIVTIYTENTHKLQQVQDDLMSRMQFKFHFSLLLPIRWPIVEPLLLAMSGCGLVRVLKNSLSLVTSEVSHTSSQQ